MTLDCVLERTKGVRSVLWLLKAKSACRTLAVTVFACNGLVSNTATAFEGDEHLRMGNLAARVALAYLKQFPGGVDENALRALTLLASDSSDTVSYGQVVRCVDYFLIPERIFSFAGRNPYPPSPTKAPEPEGNPLPKKLGEHCDAEGTSFIQASHFNHAHFQQDLLMSLRYGRLRAVSMARYENNYYEALVANAIADHYLHDFFAPGHIVTPRSAMTDVLATAMHDRANEEGVRFLPSNLKILRPILHFICGLDRNQMLGKDECRAERGNLLDELMGKNKIADITNAMRDLAEPSPSSVKFRGDSHLWDMAPEQVVQRVLLLAVEVHSIIEVLLGGDSSSFYDWKYEPKTGRVTAKFYFGEYVFTDAAEAQTDSSESPVDSAQQPSRWTTPLSVASNDQQYQLKTISPILGISWSRESVIEHAKTARNVVSAEVSLPIYIFETRRPLVPNLVLGTTIGVAGYQDDREYLFGPTFRAFISVPETEFSLGVYIRRLSYATSSGEVRKNSLGFRADFGFTGYLTLFAMLGRDYGKTSDDNLEKGALWSVGLALVFPWSRVKNATKMFENR